MGKNNIFKIIIGIAVVGIGAYALLTGGKLQFTGNGISVTKTITNKSETFTGDLLAAVAKGTPYKCTFKNPDGTSGVGYMKQKKYYGEVTMQGKAGYIIMVDSCIWTWDKATLAGAKMCFEGDIWSQQEGKPQGEYTCTSTTVDDSMFTPPANVKFIDVDKGIEGIPTDE